MGYWDNNDGLLTPDPGVLQEANCGICKEKMTVQRNVYGPRSYVEAVKHMGSYHDIFECPNINERWHQQIRLLKEQLEHSSSSKVRELIEQEIAEILRTRQATLSDEEIDYLLLR
ncbi:MAG: hypothetical protein HYW78_02520 [Parcubacteria group bacterium]|nr:hypothetical protein [Parcubacteria group bacterium]